MMKQFQYGEIEIVAEGIVLLPYGRGYVSQFINRSQKRITEMKCKC